MKYTTTLNMLFRIQIRYDNVYRNSNSFVMFYLFWLLSKIGHFQVCWLIQDVRGSRAQVKWLAVIVSLENDIFGIAYTSTVRLTQSNSNWYLVKFLSRENFIRRCHHKNVSWRWFYIFGGNQMTGIKLEMDLGPVMNWITWQLVFSLLRSVGLNVRLSLGRREQRAEQTV